MKKSIKAFAAAIATLLIVSGATTARAMAADHFTAVPFVAADRDDTTDFAAKVVSAPGSPFSVATLASTVPEGTYAGVLVTADGKHAGSFQKLSFLLGGPDTTRVTVHFREPGRSSYSFSSLTAKDGQASGKSTDRDFRLVSFDAKQFGLPLGSIVDRIVISPDTSQGVGEFLASDIKINDSFATKNLQHGTRFFRVVHGTGSGPLGHFAHSPHGRLAGPTSMTLCNNTSRSVTVYMTAQPSGFYASGANVPLTQPNGTAITVTQDPNNVAIGYFTLNSRKCAIYSAGQNLNVNIYCPIAGASPPDNMCSGNVGATFAEVNINNTTGETVDISEVNGVNAQMAIGLPHHGQSYACTWSNGSYLIPSGPHQQQYIPVNLIENHPGPSPFYGDYGNPGVFPFGCTNCESRYSGGVPMPGCASVTYPSQDIGCDNAINPYNPGNTTPPPNVTSLPTDKYSPFGSIYATPNYFICQIQRAPGCTGGAVAVYILKYPWSGQ